MADDLRALGVPIHPTWRHEALQAQAQAELCALMHSIVEELQAASGSAWRDLAAIEAHALLNGRQEGLKGDTRPTASIPTSWPC